MSDPRFSRGRSPRSLIDWLAQSLRSETGIDRATQGECDVTYLWVALEGLALRRRATAMPAHLGATEVKLRS
jgi:hypothetical protein